MTSSLPLVAVTILAFAAGVQTQPLQEPVVKVVYLPVTVIPPGGLRPVRKSYTDRIPLAVEVSTHKKAVEETKPVLQVRAEPRARRLPCKPGRTRNAQGQCGRWGNPQ